MESATERPVLAIDLGGTQIRAALITPDPGVHARRAEPTDDGCLESVLRRVCEMAAAVRGDRLTSQPAVLGPDVSLIGALPIVRERIGDSRSGGRSHRPQMAVAQQGAASS